MLKIKQGFKRELIAGNSISGSIGYPSIAGYAAFFNGYRAGAGVLHFFDLVICWLKNHPRVNRSAAFHGFVITVCICFLFTGKSS